MLLTLSVALIRYFCCVITHYVHIQKLGKVVAKLPKTSKIRNVVVKEGQLGWRRGMAKRVMYPRSTLRVRFRARLQLIG